MKKLWFIPSIGLLLAVGSIVASELEPAVSEGKDAELSESKKVYIVPIREDINTPLLYVVRRGVKEAISAGADALVIDMETRGGRVDTTEELIKVIGRFPGQKVTWVNTKALSAGAFISVATEKIFMAPESVIGAAAPMMVSPGGMGVEQMPNTMEIKITSAISAIVRANASKYGHNPDVIEAMIDKNKELIVEGEVLCEKGELLTLTNLDAEKRYGEDQKPLLSSGTISSLDELMATLGLENASIVQVEQSGAESLALWLTRISPILLIIGVIGLYLEFKTPGFGLPGIVGLSAFALYFLSGYIAGLSGIGWGAVFILGLLLLIIEILLIPGTVIAGLIGGLMMIGAIVMALVDWNPWMPELALPTADQFYTPVQTLILATAGVMVLILVLNRYFPKTRFHTYLVSQTASGAKTDAVDQDDKDTRLGLQGEVISPLHPGGKARFGDRIFDVITQGEMIEPGQEVKIIGYSGRDAIVTIL